MDDSMTTAQVGTGEEDLESVAKRARQVRRVLWIILILNVLVAVSKFAYGTLTSTLSMRADGIHSFFDGVGNIVGIVGISLAQRPADSTHPYGHAKFETLASAVIGALLLTAAYNVASNALGNLIDHTSSPDVTSASFAVLVITLGINIIVTAYEHRQARKLKSPVLLADSRHTLSDVLVTVGVIVGLVFVRMGFEIVDSIVSLGVAAVILCTSFEVFKQVNATLIDHSRISSADIKATVEAVDGVASCHRVRTRGSEAEVYADLHILVDPDMTISRAHMVAEAVEDRLRVAFPSIVEVLVHVEPDTNEEREKDFSVFD